MPGPQDPGIVKVYPRFRINIISGLFYSFESFFNLYLNFKRSGILPHVTEYIRKKVPHCHFPSNPCRIQFGSRQIVIFREDLLQKMSRNAIKIPDPEKFSEDVRNIFIRNFSLFVRIFFRPLK